jgi:hypothetical protein
LVAPEKGHLVFRWPDVAATLGIVALAILGGYLKVLPDKLVTALVMAAVGYYAARTALSRRDAKDASAAKDAKDERKEQREDDRRREDGIVEDRTDIQESGRINIKPQQSGRIVEVSSDGTVHIGPALDLDSLHELQDPTPADGVPPVQDPNGNDDEDKGD